MISFEVNGMSCGHCVKTITRAIQALDATARVQVDLAAKTVSVDDSRLPQQHIASAIADAGYEVVRPRD